MTEGDETAAQKAALRAVQLRKLRMMTDEDRAERSSLIFRRILASEAWQKAGRVLLFSPMRTEPDISPLQSAAAEARKSVAVIPATARDESELALPFAPDFILVPGLAFSRGGHRLGRGGGFYDRLLAGRAKDALKLGTCFSLQLVDPIPAEAHDVILDAIISD